MAAPTPWPVELGGGRSKDVRDGDTYTAQAPTLVGDHLGFVNRVRGEVGESGTAVVGFDFPNGVPSQYVALSGIIRIQTLSSRLTIGSGLLAIN